jgi:hypothetical protein
MYMGDYFISYANKRTPGILTDYGSVPCAGGYYWGRFQPLLREFLAGVVGGDPRIFSEDSRRTVLEANPWSSPASSGGKTSV